MALQGDIGEFPITDIIQLLDLSKKTGAVQIRGKRGNQEFDAWLYFREGKIIGARCDDLPALEAAYTFFTFTSGPFTFIEDLTIPSAMITQSNEVIIMEGIMRQDAWHQIQELVPSMNMVPRLVPNPASGSSEINLEAEEWRVLTMVNGKNTVGQIAQRSGLGEFRTCEIIAQLLQNGLIERRELNLAETLFPELERVASTALGNTARVLLQDAYKRAGIRDHASATGEQVLASFDYFEDAVSLLIGPSRARQLATDLRTQARRILSGA